MKCENAISQLVNKGDLSRLGQEDRDAYYGALCETLGLNPLTVPFEYLTLNGKTILYAKKSCTDQLRSVHGISVTDLIEEEKNGVYCVRVKVKDKEGREDCDMGTVSLIDCKRQIKRDGKWYDNPGYGQRISQEDEANAMLKAATKAKRRATLSICGLGMLDETEVETIPGAVTGGGKEPAPQTTNDEAVKPEDPKTTSSDKVVLPTLGKEAAQSIQRNILKILGGKDQVYSSPSQIDDAVKVALEKYSYTADQFTRLMQPLRYEWYRLAAMAVDCDEAHDECVAWLKNDLIRSQIGEKGADEILSCLEGAAEAQQEELAKLSPRYR